MVAAKVSSRLPRLPTTRMCSRSRLCLQFAFRDADPVGALDAMRRGLVIAQDSGNRVNESSWRRLARLRPNMATRWPRSITSRWRSATSTIRATPRDPRRAGRPRRSFRPARTLRTCSHHRRVRPQPPRRAAYPEINTAIAHLRDVLGDQIYESLARKGETMTTAAMVTYAYDQIDQARTELEHPS